ncbi:hypothetical protein [Actinoplanes sp. RD1]|uniref:hypothetical protein n=1 Tax=Actinoplanes sp. RD1 TaxID=3064538 RepID=UPI00274091B5|nr:hypothetical protein [Actinoplanes sp. RD1]
MPFDEDSPELRPPWARTGRRWILVAVALAATSAVGARGVRTAHAGPATSPSSPAVTGDSGQANSDPEAASKGSGAANSASGAAFGPSRGRSPEERLAELNAFVQDGPDLHADGYIATVDDAATGSMVLLWHGPVTRTQAAIREKAAQLGIALTVQQRRYSFADLDSAARLLAERSGQGAFANFTVAGASAIVPGFDGVVVTGDYRTPPAGDRAAADTALARAATAEAGVAVRIEPGGPMMPL